MVRVFRFFLLSMLACAICAPANARPVSGADASVQSSMTTDDLIAQFKQAAALLDKHDVKGAKAMIAPAVASSAFNDLQPKGQFAVLDLLAVTQAEDSDPASLQTAKRLTAMSEFADGDAWSLRFWTDIVAADDADGLATLTTIAKQWPDSFGRTDDEAVGALIARTARDQALADRRFDLLVAMRQSGWKPSDPIRSPDYIWSELTRLLLLKGQVDEARTVAKPIIDYGIIEQMLMQRAFDPVTQDDGQRFDPQHAMDNNIRVVRGDAKANPNRLEAINDLAMLLTEAGKADEALSLLDAALARSKQGEAASPAFTDADQINWTYNQRAYALLALGRTDEALRQMTAGAGRPENGGDNVSQQLNLAEMYESVGRPADALKIIVGADHWSLSPYGQSDYQGVKACINAELGDKAELAKSIAYLEAHDADAHSWTIDALICANDLEDAAKYVIRDLDDPGQRPVVLAEFKEQRLPATLPPVLKERQDRIAQLYQRPDVRAAIDKVGRRISAPFYNWE